MNTPIPWRRGLAAVAAAGLATVLATPAHAAEATGSVSDPIISGLIGPLGLDVTAQGTIFVAENFAGRVTRVLPNGTRTTLFQGGEGVIPNGVTSTGYLGRVVMTLSIGSAGPEQPATETQLVQVKPNGTTRVLASLFDHETATNPDAGNTYGFVGLPAGCLGRVPPELAPYDGILDSNPYKVTTINPYTFAVADAAGNSILRVTNGAVETVAVLPPVPQRITFQNFRELGLPLCTVGRDYLSEPVPTDVEVGPDGYWYVSSLPGAPELPGYGGVYRVDPNTGSVALVTQGLSGAVDLAVDDDGTIYIAEIFGNRISQYADGTLSTVAEVSSPGAVEIAADGTIYATTGVFGPAGDVVIVNP